MTRSVGLLLYVIPQRIFFVFFFVQEREQEYEESLAQNAEKIVSDFISPANAAEGYACGRLFTSPLFFCKIVRIERLPVRAPILVVNVPRGRASGLRYSNRGREVRK